ncbi:ABC transporter substrate-binding protein [Limobrevibacterium gyesilva]|uniref:ABC transporter substrate-binding protein n=1 Tax=Limobrevibacterium gyesilva TaxID=2991712 RepID=A0AA42CJX6_9PROT|nr:ABC transporter substrate-binding protein [Limobrevibacterium gyesilva]MCW3477290.1 ABC transporter substrate-binding protein [Limobrevibacterium gyesilva]
MKRRTLLTAMAGGAVALAAPRLSAAEKDRVLTFVPQADLAILDPVWTSATITRQHGSLVYDTLYGQDEQYRTQPQMVAGHSIERDGRLWRLTLRDGLRFHDGEPVRAQDVVPSLERWGRRDAFGSALLAATDELRAESDRVVAIQLKKPFPLLADALGKSGVNMPCIMPERLARTDAMTKVTDPTGSGPYRFVPGEWVPGSQAVYRRFDGYVPRADGVPSLTAGPKIARFERIVWKIIPDAATAAAALQSGEVDWWERPTADTLPLLRRGRGVRVQVLDPAGALQFLRFNWLHPPFDNPAIRRAILGAVNQTDYMMAAGGNDPAMWNDHCGAFCPGTPLASEVGMEALTGPRDIERVKRDLAAAGYRGERVVFMGVSDVPEIQAITEVAADMFRRIGLNLDYQVADWGTVVQRRTSKAPPDKGGWNVHHSGFGGLDMASPASNLAMRGNGRDAWFGWPDDPKLEELRSAWFDAPDFAAQKSICDAIQRQVFQNVPYIPLGLIKRATAYRDDLVDMVKGGIVFTNVRRG